MISTSLLLLLLSFAASLSANDPQAAQPNAQAIKAAVQTAFGATVEPVTGFKPYFVTGDFNGDAAQDLVVVVRLNQGHKALAKDVVVSNPFGYGAMTSGATLALAIIHGGKAGWQTSPAFKFVVLGESPVLILQAQRATEADAAKDLISLKRKRARRPRGEVWPPATARGDGIVLGTEATDSILYWDGRAYRWLESSGGE